MATWKARLFVSKPFASILTAETVWPYVADIYRPISDAVNRGKPISNAFITKLAKVMAEREAEYSSSGSIAAPELFSEHFNGVFRNKGTLSPVCLTMVMPAATKLIDGYKGMKMTCLAFSTNTSTQEMWSSFSAFGMSLMRLSLTLRRNTISAQGFHWSRSSLAI